MEILRQRLSIFTFCLTLLATCAFAQSTLSQIQDTVYTPNGTLFNGTVIITWTGSSTQSGNSPAPYNTSVNIYNGALSVLLVPSTTVTPAAYYQAVYNSSDGLVTWTETWQVAPSSTPLTLAQVRTTNSSDAGTGGGAGNDGSPITISQVSGLNSYLSALNNSITSITALVNAFGATITSMSNSLANVNTEVTSLTAGTTNAAFSDAEIPGGTVNGSNASFTLASNPGAAASVMLFRNGLVQTNGVDYTLSGRNVTFTSGEIPRWGDVLVAYYRLAGTGPTSTFIDDEVPQGAVNGINQTFTLSAAPNPAASLKLFKNGSLLEQNADYQLNGTTVTFLRQSATPQAGDSVSAYYRVRTGS